MSGPIIQVKPGYDENGFKIVNETHYKELSVTEVERFLTEHPDAIILDTRSPEEFAAGHLPNAKNYNLSTLEDLKPARDFVAESIGVVERDVASGKTLEEVKANAEFREKYKQWNNGGRWLEAVYRSIHPTQTALSQTPHDH